LRKKMLRRRSIRLKGYDYAQPGAYFVTLNTRDRECLFGEVRDGEMVLNDFGRLVENEWRRLEKRFEHVKVDAFVVMPDHVHGVLVVTEQKPKKNPPIVGARRPNEFPGEFDEGEIDQETINEFSIASPVNPRQKPREDEARSEAGERARLAEERAGEDEAGKENKDSRNITAGASPIREGDTDTSPGREEAKKNPPKNPTSVGARHPNEFPGEIDQGEIDQETVNEFSVASPVKPRQKPRETEARSEAGERARLEEEHEGGDMAGKESLGAWDDSSGASPIHLGAVVGAYKATTARLINGLLRRWGEDVWQCNYYEKIVRNEEQLKAIRKYIENNPQNWNKDKSNS
jgi:REP element-mobilizing transposase RayT